MLTVAAPVAWVPCLTPVGRYLVRASAEGLVAIDHLPEGERLLQSGAPWGDLEARRTAEQGAKELEEYFRGDRRAFSVPLDPPGTEFQRRIWDVLLQVPFGETRSYAWVAARAGVPRAARAAGRAIGTNPIPIIVPCHRIVGSDGSLTGYAGGLAVKRMLLALEAALR